MLFDTPRRLHVYASHSSFRRGGWAARPAAGHKIGAGRKKELTQCVSSFFLPASILWPAAGLAAQPPHLKEQSDEQMRLWRGVSTSWCNQLVDWEATPDLSRALRREKSKRWSFLRKCDWIRSIVGGIDSKIFWYSSYTIYPSLNLPEFYV